MAVDNGAPSDLLILCSSPHVHFKLRVQPSSTVRQVKLSIHRKRGWPVEDLRLLTDEVHSQTLVDGSTLWQCGIGRRSSPVVPALRLVLVGTVVKLAVELKDKIVLDLPAPGNLPKRDSFKMPGKMPRNWSTPRSRPRASGAGASGKSPSFGSALLQPLTLFANSVSVALSPVFASSKAPQLATEPEPAAPRIDAVDTANREWRDFALALREVCAKTETRAAFRIQREWEGHLARQGMRRFSEMRRTSFNHQHTWLEKVRPRPRLCSVRPCGAVSDACPLSGTACLPALTTN